MDASTIIETLGGDATVAQATGAAVNSVTYWRRRDSIPVSRWSALIELAKSKSKPITLDVLASHRVKVPA